MRSLYKSPILVPSLCFRILPALNSSGRYRGGVSFTERSLFGWRDRLQLIGVFSHGSRSFMGSYSVPLNSFGTRLTASYSYGRVKVVDGTVRGLRCQRTFSISVIEARPSFVCDFGLKTYRLSAGSTPNIRN